MGDFHRKLPKRYKPQSAVNCSTLSEQTAGSQPNASQVNLQEKARTLRLFLQLQIGQRGRFFQSLFLWQVFSKFSDYNKVVKSELGGEVLNQRLPQINDDLRQHPQAMPEKSPANIEAQMRFVHDCLPKRMVEGL